MLEEVWCYVSGEQALRKAVDTEGAGRRMPGRCKPDGPVLIVDPDEVLRSTLVAALEEARYETREASTGEEALASARRKRPGLVVLEVSLPRTCGYEVCRQLRYEFGDLLPIVFISGDRTQSRDRVAGFLVGGDEYLVKPFALDEFVVRLRRLIQRSSPGALAIHSLTRREVEVLNLLAQGLGRNEIARRLFVSPKTAGTHTERIFKKLGVHSRAEAIAFAFREGLVGDYLAGEPGVHPIEALASG